MAETDIRKVIGMAAAVYALDHDWNSANHYTTGAHFMYDAPEAKRPFDEADWQERRNAILSPIAELRQEAIWELGRSLSDEHLRFGRVLAEDAKKKLDARRKAA
ncbi:MAG: hypothetical protein WCF22_13135 [Candidatus Sulfotelmatobacter sp.]